MKGRWRHLLQIDPTTLIVSDLEQNWVVIERRGLPVVCGCHHWIADEK
jgi:hypothetical protein